MCDVAHALLLEQVEGDARARWTAGALGGDDTTPDEFRARLESMLDEEPSPVESPVDPDLLALRRALGVA